MQALVAQFGQFAGRAGAQQHLADSEARFRALTEHAPLGVFATDAWGRFDYTNASWQALSSADLTDYASAVKGLALAFAIAL